MMNLVVLLALFSLPTPPSPATLFAITLEPTRMVVRGNRFTDKSRARVISKIDLPHHPSEGRSAGDFSESRTAN